jgi:hypothetical protein
LGCLCNIIVVIPAATGLDETLQRSTKCSLRQIPLSVCSKTNEVLTRHDMDDPSPCASKFPGQLRVAPTSDRADTGEPNSMLFANGHQKCAHGAIYMHLGIKGCPRPHGHRMHMEQHGMHPLGRVPTGSAFIYSSGSQQ